MEIRSEIARDNASSSEMASNGDDENIEMPNEYGHTMLIGEDDIDVEMESERWCRENSLHHNVQLNNTVDAACSNDSNQQTTNVAIFNEYDGAAKIVSDGDDLYTQIWESDPLYKQRRHCNAYYPFSGVVEWEIVQWLHSLDVSLDRLNNFFKLRYVSLNRI